MSKKIKMIGSIGIIGVFLITLGISLAFFNYIQEGVTENSLRTGTLVFHYDEISKKGRGITITDALPTDSNELEKNSNKYFEFSVSGKVSTQDISYVVTARKSSNSDNLDNIIDLYLTDDNDNELNGGIYKYNELPQYKKVNNYTEKVIYTDTIERGTTNFTKNFKLRMWIDENVDFMGTVNESTGEIVSPYNNKTFSITVNVYTDTDIEDYQLVKGPGLYDSNNHLLANWNTLVNDYDLDVEKDYTEEDFDFIASDDNFEVNAITESHIEYIVSNNNEFNDANKLIIGDVDKIGVMALVTNNQIKEVHIPDSVTEIGESACFGVDTLYYTGPAEDTEGNEWLAGALNPVVENGIIYTDSTKTVVKGYSGTAEHLVIPDGVTTILEKAFYNNKTLIGIDVPDSVTSIGQQAFMGASPGVRYINYTGPATAGHGQLYDKLIWGVFAINPYIEGDFTYTDSTKQTVTAYLGNDTSITIPTGVVAIDDYAFFGYFFLTSVTIPNTVTSIGKDAFNVTKIKNLNIPNTVTSIGSDAFNGIININYTGTATIEENDHYTKDINWGALTRNAYIEGDFAYSDSTKTNLVGYLGNSTSVTVPEGVITIGEYVFSSIYTDNINSITLPSTLTTISEKGFWNFNLIKTITIPANVNYIGANAFEATQYLDDIVFENPNGWKAGDTSISSTDLNNTSTAATYLKDTYKDKIWTRE